MLWIGTHIRHGFRSWGEREGVRGHKVEASRSDK